MSFLSLKDYGLIGNGDSGALISRQGAIEWCCFPYFDSPSHFGSLLDDIRGGSFQIQPTGDFDSEQRYIENSCVLETLFEASGGRGKIIDWMPLDGSSLSQPILCRRVEVTEGALEWEAQCTPRFNFGADPAAGELSADGVLFRGNHSGDLGFLKASVKMALHQNASIASGKFLLKQGESAQFIWIWGRHHHRFSVLGWEETAQNWRKLVHSCDTASCLFAGPWHETVSRSGLIVRMLTTRFSGAITESVTTSLPNLAGGSRNWDYRYCWIRNSAFSLQALLAMGYQEQAQKFFSWLADVIVRDGPEELQSVYSLDGGRFLPEREIPTLSGYAGSRPVRVGNLSARQFHLDVFGHVMLTASLYHRTFNVLPDGLWSRLQEIADYICQAWRRPDRGPWESRSKPEHSVTSKVMCWVALDNANSLSRALGEKPPARWKNEMTTLHRTIMEQGFDESRRSFVGAFGDRKLDASVLLIPIVGFLPPDDERVLGTLDALRSELSAGVLLQRTEPEEDSPESDGAHLYSSLLFVSALALSGKVEEASDRLAEICTFATSLGLFAEQVNPQSGEPIGNYPSSSSHLALINAAVYLGAARGRRLPLIPIPTSPRAHSSKAA